MTEKLIVELDYDFDNDPTQAFRFRQIVNAIAKEMFQSDNYHSYYYGGLFHGLNCNREGCQ